MRRCPYCAEDIADDVTRCPHCGSDLTTAPTPAGQQASWGAPQPAPPAGPVQFSHTGQRFLLGYDASDFGIWDRSSPGGPVERFPRSDDGWAQAWRRYASLEPNSQAVQASAPGPGPGPYGGPGVPATSAPWQQQPVSHVQQVRRTNGMAVASLVLGLVGVVTFFLVAIPPILALVFGLVARSQIRRSGGTQEGEGLAIAGIVLGIVMIAVYGIVLVSVTNSGGI